MKLQRGATTQYTIDDYFGMHDERLTNRAKVNVKQLKEFHGIQLK